MRYTRIRAQTFAVYRGREYESTAVSLDGTVFIRSTAAENPLPDVMTWNERGRLWTAQVPALDCDRVYRANAYARYQGQRVNVSSVDQTGTAQVYFDDVDSSWAEDNGFEQVDKYVFLKSVPAAELYDVHEQQSDLQFDLWRESTFVRPPSDRPVGRR